MGLRELKKELSKMEKTEIIKMVSELYKTTPMAKDYLDLFVTGNTKQLIDKYILKIEKYIYPQGRDMIVQEKEARKLIRTIRKMKIAKLTVALELHYVKCCMDIIEGFGYWEETYYIAVDKMFYSATKNIIENNLGSKYDKQITDLVNRSYECGLDFEH